MSYSLPSREVIADSIETVMRAQWYDGLVCVPGCDKNMPGCLLAMVRVNRPSLIVYGGTIGKGCGAKGQPLDIVSAFQSYGQYLGGKIDEETRADIIQNACPGAGACGGMYTANTSILSILSHISVSSAIEALGLSLPGSASTPAKHLHKLRECDTVGKAMENLLTNNITPLSILTKKSFENAIRLAMVLGGLNSRALTCGAQSFISQVPPTLFSICWLWPDLPKST